MGVDVRREYVALTKLQADAFVGARFAGGLGLVQRPIDALRTS